MTHYFSNNILSQYAGYTSTKTVTHTSVVYSQTTSVTDNCNSNIFEYLSKKYEYILSEYDEEDSENECLVGVVPGADAFNPMHVPTYVHNVYHLVDINANTKSPFQFNNYNVANPRGTPRVLKLLVNPDLARIIIGKGGDTIMNLKIQSNAFVVISRRYDKFPGTDERVCMLVGTCKQIKIAIGMIHDEILKCVYYSFNPDLLRFLITPEAGGLLIGKKGYKIRELKEKTKCSMKVEKPLENWYGLDERVLEIKGEWSRLREVIDIVLFKNCVYPPSDYLDYNRMARIVPVVCAQSTNNTGYTPNINVNFNASGVAVVGFACTENPSSAGHANTRYGNIPYRFRRPNYRNPQNNGTRYNFFRQ